MTLKMEVLLEQRVIKIIKKLPILDELKDYIIAKLDTMEKAQLVEILYNFSTGIEKTEAKKKIAVFELNKSMLNFKQAKSKQEEEKELSHILDGLESIFK